MIAPPATHDDPETLGDAYDILAGVDAAEVMRIVEAEARGETLRSREAMVLLALDVVHGL